MCMQTLPLNVLHDQVDVLGRVDCLDQFNDALVIEPTENSYLSDGLFLPMDVHQFESVVLFDGYMFPCIAVECLFDNCIGPFAYLFAKVVGGDVRTACGCELVSPGPVLILNVMGRLRPHLLRVQCVVVVASPLHHLLLLVVYFFVVVLGILTL